MGRDTALAVNCPPQVGENALHKTRRKNICRESKAWRCGLICGRRLNQTRPGCQGARDWIACGLAQIHHVLEIKSDLVSMVIEHFRPPWWLLKKVKLTCGSRFSSNSSGVRTGSRGARLLTLAVVGMRYPKYPDREDRKY